MASASTVTCIPLVKGDAFIGLDEYKEKLQAMLERAISVSNEKDSKCIKRKRDTYDSDNLSTENGGQLAACNAVIGLDPLPVEQETFNNADNTGKKVRRLNNDEPTDEVDNSTDNARDSEPSTKSTCRKRKRETDHSDNSTSEIGQLVACSSIIGLDLLGVETETSEEVDNVGRLHNSDLQENVNCATDNKTKVRKLDSNEKTKNLSNDMIAKSKQLSRAMPLVRLMKMEEAVKEWNNYFGTKYTLL